MEILKEIISIVFVVAAVLALNVLLRRAGVLGA
jgi:hypothetical protein